MDKEIELNNSYTHDKNNFRSNVFFHYFSHSSKTHIEMSPTPLSDIASVF